MRSVVNVFFKLALFLMLGLVGCSSSKNAVRVEGMGELQRMSSAVQDMHIVVSAGVTKDEYSKRLTDALLKFGDRDGGCNQAIAKFPDGDQQSTAAEVCQHLSRAMEAYTYAKDYIGPKPDPIDSDYLLYTLTEKEYADAKLQFPSLEELPVAETNENGYKFYHRSEMVQGLWKVADQEFEAAKTGMDKIAQM